MINDVEQFSCVYLAICLFFGDLYILLSCLPSLKKKSDCFHWYCCGTLYIFGALTPGRLYLAALLFPSLGHLPSLWAVPLGAWALSSQSHLSVFAMLSGLLVPYIDRNYWQKLFSLPFYCIDRLQLAVIRCWRDSSNIKEAETLGQVTCFAGLVLHHPAPFLKVDTASCACLFMCAAEAVSGSHGTRRTKTGCEKASNTFWLSSLFYKWNHLSILKASPDLQSVMFYHVNS